VILAGAVISALNEALSRAHRQTENAIQEQQARVAEVNAGALQNAIFSSATFSCIATDAQGVIQLFNVGAERMLGFTAAEVLNQITPADLHDPREVIARATALSRELGTIIAPGFEALVFKASRGIEDVYELTKIRKDGSRFPAVVSVTALRDGQGGIIGYLLIGTDNTGRKQAEEALLKAGALQRAIFNSANFSSIATDAKGVIQIFNVGAERMLGYTAAEAMNKITPADISDPQEVIARAQALSAELGTPITPGFEALVFKASRGIEDIYDLTYIRKDGSRFPAVVSVTALRDGQGGIIGYLLIGTDNTARKQAEEALLKAGALQRAIFNSANFSSIATDAKGVIQIFNVGAERMLGYTAAEAMNKITPADISDPQEVIARAKALSAELGTPITPGFEALVFKASRGLEDIYDLTYIRKDGSRLPAVVSVTALHDAQNNIIGYLLIGTDNTARQRIEEERKAALRELNDVKAAIDQHAIVAITDPTGKITYVNDKFCRISKYPREELLGQDHRLINSGFHPKEFMRGLWQTISEGRVWKGEIKNKAKDGSFYWGDVTIVPYLGENQKPIQYIAIRTDVTERKLAEEVSARFAAMVEFSDDAIISKTLDGRIISWNPGAEKLLGYPAAEAIGKSMQTFIPPEWPNEEVEILARIARGENIQPFETVRVRKDGQRIDVSVTISPIKDVQGKVVGVSKIARDITQRKRFEHALQQTNVELERARLIAEKASNAKSEFISGMSHELRTPLNGIIGFTEFLIDEKPGPLRPKQKEYLGDVLNSGRHLLQLINDVLDLAKVEAGKMELHLETFPVRKAVEEVTAVVYGIASKKQIAITIEIGPDLDAVTLDQHKFKQILYNLLSNAVKFSNDGGQVSIRAHRLDTRQLEVAVRDAGIGIKAEDIGRLFHEFEQLDSGTARRFEGTGLGLALTRKIVEFQGGHIRVESQPGHGSTFTVVLPVEIKREGTA